MSVRRPSSICLLVLLLAAGASAAGPESYLLMDINPGAAGSNSARLGQVNGVELFGGGPLDDLGLWRTGGTREGTLRIADAPGRYGVVRGGFLYYIGSGGLWRSDGTAEGTSLAAAVAGNIKDHLAGVDDRLFFVVRGDQLWASDLKAGSAALVLDLSVATSATYCSVDSLVEAGGRLYFVNHTPIENELWTSDGSEAGTVRLRGGFATHGGGLAHPTAVGDLLFFHACELDSDSAWLWRSDGTDEGTVKLTQLGLGEFEIAAFGEPPAAWFNRSVNMTDPCSGANLWRSDGTVAGTMRAVRHPSWSCPPSPRRLTVSGGRLYFEGSGCSHKELWSTDGTLEGTTRAARISDRQIWMLTDAGGTLYFRANDEVHGYEAWRSDGTEAGTYAIGDIVPGPESSSPMQFSRLGSRLIFTAFTPGEGGEPWVHDLEPRTAALLRDDSLGSIEGPVVLPLPLDAAGDRYLDAFTAWDEEPDAGVLADTTRPLVFYGVESPAPLHLAKTAAGGIRIRF